MWNWLQPRNVLGLFTNSKLSGLTITRKTYFPGIAAFPSFTDLEDEDSDEINKKAED